MPGNIDISAYRQEAQRLFPNEARSLFIPDPTEDIDKQIKEIRDWLKSQGVELTSPPAPAWQHKPAFFPEAPLPYVFQQERERQIKQNDELFASIVDAVKNGRPRNVSFPATNNNSGIKGQPNVLVAEAVVTKEYSASALSGRAQQIGNDLLAGQTYEMWAQYSVDHEFGHFLAFQRGIISPQGINAAQFHEVLADTYALLRHQQIYGTETGMREAVAAARSLAPVSSHLEHRGSVFLHDTSNALDHLPSLPSADYPLVHELIFELAVQNAQTHSLTDAQRNALLDGYYVVAGDTQLKNMTPESMNVLGSTLGHEHPYYQAYQRAMHRNGKLSDRGLESANSIPVLMTSTTVASQNTLSAPIHGPERVATTAQRKTGLAAHAPA
jgi:hypothetical protein